MPTTKLSPIPLNSFPEHLRETHAARFASMVLAEDKTVAFLETNAIFLAWIDWADVHKPNGACGSSPSALGRDLVTLGFRRVRRGSEGGFSGLRILPVGDTIYSIYEKRERAIAAMLAELIPPMFSYRRLQVFVPNADLYSGFEEHYPDLAGGMTQTAFARVLRGMAIPGLRHWMTRRSAGNGFMFQPTRAPKLEDLL